MRDGGSAMHHDDQRSFTAEEVDEELKKGVKGEGLVNVTERIDPESDFERDETGP